MLKNINPVGYHGSSSREIGGIDIVFKANYPNRWALYPISNKNPLVPQATDFTISFDLRNTIGVFGFEVTDTIATAGLIGRIDFQNTSNVWKRFSQTYNSGYHANIGGLNLYGVGEIRHIKFELGNKSTAWSINPDDVEEMKLIGESIGGVSTKGLIYYNNFNSVSDMQNPRLGFNISGTYPTSISEGKVMKAATFNGTNHCIKTSIDPLKQLMGDFTISAWINPTAWGNYRGIAGDHASGGLIFGQSEGANVHFAIAISNTAWVDIKLPVINLKVNNWHHVVMRVSGNRFSLFINNISKWSSANFTTRKFLNTFWIGQASDGAGRRFSGQIDEFMVFDRALSEDEITNLYSQNDNYLNEAMKKGSTDIQGGVVLSQVMGVKNMNNELTGGISGLTGAGDDVRMFFASKVVTMNEANEAARVLTQGGIDDIPIVFKFLIDKLGNVYGNNVYLKNAFVNGVINAVSGKIGYFEIFENGEIRYSTPEGFSVVISPNGIPAISDFIGTNQYIALENYASREGNYPNYGYKKTIGTVDGFNPVKNANMWSSLVFSSFLGNPNDTIKFEFDLKINVWIVNNFNDDTFLDFLVCISPGFDGSSPSLRPIKPFKEVWIDLRNYIDRNPSNSSLIIYEKRLSFEFSIKEFNTYLASSGYNFARIIFNWTYSNREDSHFGTYSVSNLIRKKTIRGTYIGNNGIASIQGSDSGFHISDNGFLIGGGSGSNSGFHKLNIGSSNGNISSNKV